MHNQKHLHPRVTPGCSECFSLLFDTSTDLDTVSNDADWNQTNSVRDLAVGWTVFWPIKLQQKKAWGKSQQKAQGKAPTGKRKEKANVRAQRRAWRSWDNELVRSIRGTPWSLDGERAGDNIRLVNLWTRCDTGVHDLEIAPPIITTVPALMNVDSMSCRKNHCKGMR